MKEPHPYMARVKLAVVGRVKAAAYIELTSLAAT